MKERQEKIRKMLEGQNLSEQEMKEAEKVAEKVLENLDKDGFQIEDKEGKEEEKHEVVNMTEAKIREIRERKLREKLARIEKPVGRGLAVIGLATVIWTIVSFIKGHSTPVATTVAADSVVTTVEGSAAVSSAVTEAALNAGADVVTTTF